MAPFRSLVLANVVVMTIALIGATQYASALVADDVTSKMTKDTRFGYLSGLVDMLAYQTAASGDREKGNCITDAFYREKMKDSWARLDEVLAKFPDKRPEILVSVLANQLCKK